jgi:hypothetical protein
MSLFTVRLCEYSARLRLTHSQVAVVLIERDKVHGHFVQDAESLQLNNHREATVHSSGLQVPSPNPGQLTEAAARLRACEVHCASRDFEAGSVWRGRAAVHVTRAARGCPVRLPSNLSFPKSFLSLSSPTCSGRLCDLGRVC